MLLLWLASQQSFNLTIPYIPVVYGNDLDALVVSGFTYTVAASKYSRTVAVPSTSFDVIVLHPTVIKHVETVAISNINFDAVNLHPAPYFVKLIK